jgi:flagellar biosynthetic protein FlhB
MADEDRTHAATPRREQRAREAGDVPISREVTTFASLGGATLALLIAGPAAAQGLAASLAALLAQSGGADVGAAIRDAMLAGLLAAAPMIAAGTAGGALADVVQGGFLFQLQVLSPDFGRLNPFAGLARLFGASGAAEVVRATVKLAVFGAVTWRVLGGDLDGLGQVLGAAPDLLLRRATATMGHLLLGLVAAQGGIAVLDLVWMRARHARSLRMSREEQRQEHRETDGNPEVKRRLGQIRAQRAKRRMMAAVPKATVVVTNPTHYAVALAYERDRSAAPRVVAKGVDDAAARIRALAKEHDVPLVANPPLARALFAVEIDAEIPPEHFQAVAQIIAYVWRMRTQAAGPVAAPARA